MYVITYASEKHRQWSDDSIFESFYDAKIYLIDRGFVAKNGVFERENYNWSTYIKAYVTPKKVWVPKKLGLTEAIIRCYKDDVIAVSCLGNEYTKEMISPATVGNRSAIFRRAGMSKVEREGKWIIKG